MYLLFSKKMLVVRAWRPKLLVEIAHMEDPDQGLHCLSRPFWQASSVQNFRTFIISQVEMLNSYFKTKDVYASQINVLCYI